MAKTDDYNKFRAIQLNNEEIAQRDFAGMHRNDDGWALSSPTAAAITGGKAVLPAGGTGAKIIDVASTEPKPQTAGQSILKAAGQWKPLNAHYAGKAEAVQLTPEGGASTAPAKEQPPTGNVQTAKQNETAKVNKTYTVNGSQMTLGEYIKSLGADPNAVYRQNVAAANAAYDRQRATYGAEAEALASQGLGQSGTSDYLDAQAYAAKQKAISQAAATRDASNVALEAQYGSYLQQERAAKDAKIQAALDRALAMQLNTENTVKYLMAMAGLTKTEAQQYAEGNTALGNATNSEDERQAKLREITDKYLSLVGDPQNGGKGMSDSAARMYLKSEAMGYDAELVDIAAGDLNAAAEQTKADAIAAQQKAVADTFEKAINVWSGADSQKALQELGINISVNEETGELGFRDVRNAITNAYNNGMLTEKQYLDLHKQNANQVLTQEISDGDLNDALQVAVDMQFDKQIQKNVEKELQSTIKPGGTSISAQGINGNVDLTIMLNGKKTVVEIDADGQQKNIPDAIKKKKAKNHTIKVHNGKLYYYYGDAKGWYELKQNGMSGNITKEQSEILYKILVQKYDREWGK